MTSPPPPAQGLPVDILPWSRTVMAVLLIVCGVTAFSAFTGVGSAVAGPSGAAITAAPLFANTALPASPEPDRSSSVDPAMRRTGTNREGWATYRLAAGRIPDRLAPGAGFRGEISWLQDGLVRKARLYVPRSVAPAAPLLVSLHGLGASLRKAEAQQHWSQLAYQQEFVLVWGAGYKGSWNAGWCCGAAVRENVDDLAYLDRLIEVTGALHSLDPRRLNLAGFSNGAMMAYRYACGRPGRIAAVLAVSGTLTAPCTPSNPTAILVVHGSADPTVPLAGTRFSATLRSALRPARQAAGEWAQTGAGVRTVVLPGFAHGWPTRAKGGYDTTGEGWRFLRQHPRPAGSTRS